MSNLIVLTAIKKWTRM